MHRRGFLELVAGSGAALAAAPWLSGARDPAGAAQDGVFRHGVASGDPLPDGVVIWTRVTPTPEATPGSGLGPDVAVRWEVATAPGFGPAVVRSGTVTARATSDHTVKVDVTGLAPATDHFYRFAVDGQASPVGCTRTAPARDAAVSRLRFGLVSCSNWEAGFFVGYRYLAGRNDLDFVLHLGDYLYEHGTGGPGAGSGRGASGAHLPHAVPHDPPTEILSLGDYRRRHAQYKTDPDLQAAHARWAWVVIFDDHEVANNAYRDGAGNHQPSEGDYLSRRNQAYQAYLEWMPVRDPVVPFRFYRNLRFGSLADLTVLDTRQYRDVQPTTTAAAGDPARTLLGVEHERFLHETLRAPDAPRWRLIGNQTVFVPFELPPGTPLNFDQWDGYAADRQQLIDVITAHDVRNVVVFTGDIHSSWANEVPRDKDGYRLGLNRESVAAEFVCTSVTSDNINELITQGALVPLGIPVGPLVNPRHPATVALEDAVRSTNPWIKYLELDSHGASVVEVTPERVQTDWYYVRSARNAVDPSFDLRLDPQAWVVFAPGQAYQVHNTIGVTNVPPGPRVVPAAVPIVDDGERKAPTAVTSPGAPVAVLRRTGALTAILGGAVTLRRRRPADLVPYPETFARRLLRSNRL